MRTPDPFSLSSSPGSRDAGLRHEHLFTSNWARFPPLSPDRPLPCRRTAWGQLSPSLLTRCHQPALWGSPLTPLRTRGVLQPLGGKLNRMCLWSTANTPTTFPAHSKNKTKQNKTCILALDKKHENREDHSYPTEPSRVILKTSKPINI